jgi:predicted 2-oxoglutarate/Fe(II)-dependent dioxygenase YbiX
MDKQLLAPAVVQYPFPERMAEELIRMLESDEQIDWNKSLVSSHGYESEVRTSQQFNFEHEMPIACSKLKPIFIDAVNDYIQEYGVNITQDEGLTLLKYSESNKYDYHVDADWTIYRVLSALIYLNPQEYEGGETHFKLLDLYVKPEKPSIVLFPSNFSYIHAAMPVTYGTKYVLVTWMNDLPNGLSHTVMGGIAQLTGRH